MLWATIIALVSIWGIACICSFTLGGWIHVLPLAAAPLLLVRVMRPEPEVAAYAKWKERR